jgi:myo-inositol-1-phosphate synthase
MSEIRVAVAGVGNCCSSLVQGVSLYSKGGDGLGLLHAELGGYKASDIRFVEAFDIAASKVGRDLSEAIFAQPNQAPMVSEVEGLGVEVRMGPAPDSVENEALANIMRAYVEATDLVKALKDGGVDVLVNLISGGSDKASRIYANACLEAGCAFLNATPTGIASDTTWDSKFRGAGLPLAGDDLLDQIGATVVHMGLLEFLNGRGVRIDESYQLDVGGGTESINTLEKTRETKRSIKTTAVTGSVPYEFPLVSGSTDFVDFLGNGRDSFFWLKGRYFGGAPFTMDAKLSTLDAPNGGSVLIDAIRALKIARDRKVSGTVPAICGYAFKRSAKRAGLTEAYRLFREFTG